HRARVAQPVREEHVPRSVAVQRAALHHPARALAQGRSGHGWDAFGVLPPIARLTPEQAMYHFLSGYTAKVAGTEIGVTEPEATFSTCFGAPFMPRFPWVYGNLLKERIAKGGVRCWLVNTGWTGGKYGTGSRMPIKATRALLNAALDGSLNHVEFRTDPNFGVEVPVGVPGVDSAILNPRDTWADKTDYDSTAARLVTLFTNNFAKFADQVDAAVLAAAPRVGGQAQPQQTQETLTTA
ncbi:MAG TPA: phosphoenolpyruvate carboxykinase (ATP), partial [Allosphingosinicella sp.]|nr:phosphoenolpyruvate carboxykinase (ATP) [Allosphingosinicella sp.]